MNVTVIVIAYLVGSIPFALWLSRRRGGADLRRAGSGNVGAANVLRTAGTTTGVSVLALDMSKGAAVAIFAERLLSSPVWVSAATAAVVVGHVFPVWLGFRGGKGVATACGAFLVLAPGITLVSMAAFVVIVWTTRYVSLGSLSASLLLPSLGYTTDVATPLVMSMATVSSLIVYRHRANVGRLFAGCERRLGQRAG